MTYIAEYQAEANYFAQIYNIRTGAHNGEIDAFRHAYVSGVVAMERGQFVAQVLGDANEWKYDIRFSNPELERNMDVWNNYVGRQLGEMAYSRAHVADRVNDALRNGELIMDLNDQRRFDAKKPPVINTCSYRTGTVHEDSEGFKLVIPGVNLDEFFANPNIIVASSADTVYSETPLIEQNSFVGLPQGNYLNMDFNV